MLADSASGSVMMRPGDSSRRFEPLTFSKGRGPSSLRWISDSLDPNRSICSPATDLTSSTRQRLPLNVRLAAPPSSLPLPRTPDCRPFSGSRVLDWSKPPFAKWLVGGKLNAAYNCVDRHVEADAGDKVAFHWVGVMRKPRPGRFPSGYGACSRAIYFPSKPACSSLPALNTAPIRDV